MITSTVQPTAGRPYVPQLQQATFQLVSSTKAEFLPAIESRQKNGITVKVKTLHPQAKLPTRGSKGAIGYDIFSTSTVTINPNEVVPVPTGIAAVTPNDVYIRIAERSSWALHHNLSIGGGVIDPDYRGR